VQVKALVCSVFLAAPVAGAVTMAGVQLPDDWTVDGQRLVLNGAGTREHGPLGIDLYAAALYLPAREREGRAGLLLGGPGLRVVHLHLLRNADRDTSVLSWEVCLAENCAGQCALPAVARQRFLALIPETRRGDTQTLILRPGSVQFNRNGKPLGTVNGAALGSAVLACWLGKAPVDADLKKDLLRR